MTIWEKIGRHITDVTGEDFKPEKKQHVGGGCINQTIKLADDRRDFFIKTNHVSHGDMFAVEALALQEMANSQTVKVPQAICYGDDGKQCYLVLEYLVLNGRVNFVEFAQQFAAMHRLSHAQFGWHHHNTIGSTVQHNEYRDSWVNFWAEQRLGFQLRLAEKNGYAGELLSLGEKLLADFPVLFSNYKPQASMLHGDLWGGNIAALSDGSTVVYDPAFYYGDRETDVAMTYLFGGFSKEFYAAYNEAWPLDDGFKVRKNLYNLYHIINHTNLFGGAYEGQAIAMIKQVLSEIN